MKECVLKKLCVFCIYGCDDNIAFFAVPDVARNSNVGELVRIVSKAALAQGVFCFFVDFIIYFCQIFGIIRLVQPGYRD